MSIFDDLNNFIRSLLTVKSKDFKSLLFNSWRDRKKVPTRYCEGPLLWIVEVSY